ncbi:MAG: prepilin peptidase [Clostridia bacterium]|nr:prepilin peptidase [Clostridia bacterium]
MIVKSIICAVFLVLINITDIKGFKIKNKVVLPTIIIGLIYGLISNSFLDSIYGMLIPLVLFPLYALKMLGAGDVKALCAVGAVLGFKLSVMTLLLTFVSGGVIALGFMLFNKNFKERFKNLFLYLKMSFFMRKMDKYNYGGGEKSYFRFSFAITTGTILAIVNNYLFII